MSLVSKSSLLLSGGSPSLLYNNLSCSNVMEDGPKYIVTIRLNDVYLYSIFGDCKKVPTKSNVYQVIQVVVLNFTIY